MHDHVALEDRRQQAGVLRLCRIDTMSGDHDSRRIFWMVRLLAAVGLTTILVLLVLVGRQISSTQAARAKLQ